MREQEHINIFHAVQCTRSRNIFRLRLFASHCGVRQNEKVCQSFYCSIGARLECVCNTYYVLTEFFG